MLELLVVAKGKTSVCRALGDPELRELSPFILRDWVSPSLLDDVARPDVPKSLEGFLLIGV
jgi:hypothetical protein